MYSYRVYNNLFWIFLIQMKYRLQSMFNHVVGRAASDASPFSIPYSLSKSNPPPQIFIKKNILERKVY